MEKLTLRPEFFWTLLDQFRRVPRKFSRPTELGCLHARGFSGIVLKVQGQWFTFRKDADFDSIFREFLEPDAYADLKEKISGAIANISEATTKADTFPFNQPIDLAIIRK